MSTVQEDAQDSILHTLTGRLRNPYYASFVLSWAAFNWRALYVTFVMAADELPLIPGQEEKYPDKLTYLDTLDHSLERLLICPAVSAFLIPIALKGLGGLLNLIVEWIEKWLNLGRKAIHKNAWVRIEEYDKFVELAENLRRRNIELQNDLANLQDVADKNKEVADREVQQGEIYRRDLENAEKRVWDQVRGKLHPVLSEVKAAHDALDAKIGTWQGGPQKGPTLRAESNRLTTAVNKAITALVIDAP